VRTSSLDAGGLTRLFVQRWRKTASTPPLFLKRYSVGDQRTNERRVERFFRELPSSAGTYEALGESDRAAVRARARIAIARALLPAPDRDINKFFEACEESAGAFVSQARAFDRTISRADLHQALRNLWVFNSIQWYLAHPVGLTPSSFAYSLLYPFTDNWLDGVGRSPVEKAAFLRWLTLRLQGRAGEEDQVREVSRLIGMVEEEFPRERFPDVHESLLAIHRAQQESLRLHERVLDCSEEILLPLTVRKGGASVVVDGFIVSGELPQGIQEALFGYGVLLQLIDDFQDLEEDLQKGHSTPVSRAAAEGSLEGVTSRLFHFTHEVVRLLESSRPGAEWMLGQVIEESCNALMLEAAARHSTLFSAEYLSLIEERSPERLPFLATMRERFRERFDLL
jgi:hypothetical protein